ncbi:MAG TPA: 50S ribosomal protein L25/general stress protein Ctc [Alphaproteobacteria bacterium]|jgi:large subunit ribosomal protein L25|nr:50S ribosomal protein L25/general stress protein Ctc [Alphaproteobacteria bacterium]
MAEAGVLEVRARPGAGKGAARAARRAGQVPGILYGGAEDPLPISMDDRAIRQAIHQPGFFSKPLHLKLDGKKVQVLPREVQVHPVTEAPVHVDFLRVAADSKIKINVPVRFENEGASPGLKRGGVLNVVRHHIEVVCSVAAIPDFFLFDLAGLDIGDSVHISKLALPPGVRLTITGRDFTVASVAAPTVAVVEEVKPEAAATPEGEAAAVPATEQKEPGAEGGEAKETKEKKEKK